MVSTPRKWTEDQLKAIDEKGKDILVAAAAGSGKTAVLVERIIKKISNSSNPVNVDELLVATFTKAAAAEMRERIREALEKEVFQDPDNAHVRRQLALINRASITTLHSFCKDVMRRYYHTIDIDSGFRVANEIESGMIRQDVLDTLMEEKYEMMVQGDSFSSLVDWFGGERDDTPLFRLIQQLNDASRSHPKPDEWLRKMAFLFDGPRAGEVWFASLMVDVRPELQSIQAMLTDALHVATSPGGPLPYVENLQSELTSLNSIIAASETTWDDLHQNLQMSVFDRLKPCKKDAFDEGLIKRVKEYRDAAKKSLEKVKEDLFKRSHEQYRCELVSMAPLIRELVELAIEFAARYQSVKNEKNLVDFSDLEHHCLKVLSVEKEEGILTPSAAALSYKKQFQEVLLDEYQDTNRVQEAIITLISHQETGNRFMVGDVKQAIYRFRLAEPDLFLEKYNRFPKYGSGDSVRVDLARNFRSRRQVIHAVNFIFRQIMSEEVGEVPYDKNAELVYGANYPEESDVNYKSELLLIDRDKRVGNSESSIFEHSTVHKTNEFLKDEAEDLEPARMEAKAVALEIKKLMGLTCGEKFRVFDKNLGDLRPVTYRDIVILMRSPQGSAPLFIEELKEQGIPAYAELHTGYFTAIEVETIISLLKIIDNPYQDIPLAAVLRSPLVGLTADDLALVRTAHRRGDFYEAIVKYVGETLPSDQDIQLSILDEAAVSDTSLGLANPRNELALKLSSFLKQFEGWRTCAREDSLADLIWRIYQDTNYYDFVGGLPGGAQRQANLNALHDRARLYESTSFRGLFRFLRFIEQMKESGHDLGTAKSMGEQEDVVRIMSIHKSKGLEFPIVFVSGIAKQFNQQDLNGHFLIHKELGFGPKFVDTDLRVTYPSLPSLAIRKRMRMEMLAEEMRVLYVALTRPREKMYLVGAVRNLEKQIHSWSKHITHKGRVLPDHELAKSVCYLDWIGPALVRHPDAKLFRDIAGFGPAEGFEDEESKWAIRIMEPSTLLNSEKFSPISKVDDAAKRHQIEEIINHRPIVGGTNFKSEIECRLNWTYPLSAGYTVFSKTSVTELKRIGEINPMLRHSLTEDGWNASPFIVSREESKFSSITHRRPRFMEERKMTATERGTVYHTVLQNLPLNKGRMSEGDIREALEFMVNKRLLTAAQADAVDVKEIVRFFKHNIGKRILFNGKVMREVPFSYGLAAADIYPDLVGPVADEIILIQGVIDCLFEVENGLVLLDYKTDSTKGMTADQLIDKYRLQINLYERAIEDTWKRPIVEKYLYFFDGGQLIEI